MVLNVVIFLVYSTKQILNRSSLTSLSVKECNVFRDLFDSKGFWKSSLIKNLHHCVAWSILPVLSKLLKSHKSLQTLPKLTALKTTHRIVILFPTLWIHLATKIVLTLPVTTSCCDRQMCDNHIISRKIILPTRSICKPFQLASFQK